jgi:hypothetical protein
MPRRKPYTKVVKKGQVRADHVKGMGDVAFKGFQCLNSECIEFLFVRADAIDEAFVIACPTCGNVLSAEGETKFYDYTLVYTEEGRVIEQGEFTVSHREYVEEALLYKYCIVCNAIKPLGSFDRHSARRSGRQGECRICKAVYNAIKNQSRIADQHREASQRRRLYRLLAAEEGRIDSRAVFDRFEGKCFNCKKRLTFRSRGQRGFGLDHTLPAKYLWPITTSNATLLCAECNNNKHDKWPSEFYPAAKLRGLSRLTSVEYGVLSGPPRINERAVEAIVSDVDGFIEEWIDRPEDIRKVRSFIREMCDLDIFEHAKVVPEFLMK